MKKRLFTLALAMSLVLGCAVFPASAADARSEEMTKVTLAVKGRLGIGDEYDKFSGDCTDLGVLRYWSLDWSKEDGVSLSVIADNTGKILSYNRYIPQDGQSVSSWESGSFSPSFPAVNAKQVESAAKTFLGKVLADRESAELNPVTLRLSGYRRSVSVSGSVRLGGAATPMSFRMSLSLPDLTVTNYSREDSWGMIVTGGVPSATPAVSAEAAKTKLDSVLTVELRYVDAGDGTIALRYVPTTEGDWFVDAQTGELVDRDKLVDDEPIMGAGGASADNGMLGDEAPAESESAAPAPSLSPVEQATVDQMAGALSAEALDKLLRKISPLGLEKLTQAGANYYMDRESGEITCRLTYSRPLEKNELAERYSENGRQYELRKYITVDAVTGALKRVSTSDSYAKELFQGDSASVVKGFLSAQYPDCFAACAQQEDGERWVRQANGIPYYSNYLRASACKVDGSIGSFSIEWNDEAVFPAPKDIVDKNAALSAYAGCYTAQLYYTAYPEKVDTSDPQWLTYSQQVGNVKYRWVLSYVLDGDQPQGVDAFNGKVLTWPGRTATVLTYTDCANCYGKAEIEALADYGVGFSRGAAFRPTAQVTQRDMLVLLLSAVGCTYDADSMDEERENNLYETAYSQGLLTKAQRDPVRTVTRMEFVKTMLASSAYGKAAQLTGIFKTSFSDAASIPAADLGYAAIAQGLGIVIGDQTKAFQPNAVLTRQDAAIMLYRLMAR